MSDQALTKTFESKIQPGRAFTPADIVDGSLNTLDRAQLLVSPQAVSVTKLLDSMDGRPLGDKIFVLPLPKDERHGTIIIPENARDEHNCGIVVAVGRGRYENGVLIPPEVNVGNYIVYSKYAGRDIRIGDITIQQISECDITFAVGK